MKEGIEFKAILNRSATTSDGGWRVTLDVGNDELDQSTALSRHMIGLLQVGIIPLRKSHFVGNLESIDATEEGGSDT